MISESRWGRAIELGVRLGIVAEGAASEALAMLREAPDVEVTTARVASWIGCGEEVFDDLLRLAEAADTPTLRLVGEGTERIASALSGTPPTVPMRPARDTAPTLPLATGDAPPVPPPVRANVPRTLGPYELLEELGHGGMGIVFRARHQSLGTPCAVKVMIAGEHASPEEIARFQLEAQAVARMGKHPNIVTVFDLGTQGALSYYAMDLVEGKSLARLLREGDLEPQEAARIVEKVARAIHFAHEKGILHRDLKPDNVVVRPDPSTGSGQGGEPQVMDFGLARDVTSTERMSVRGQVMGSPNYMAPEQARGDVEALDRRTDVYGLGAILYETLCRFPPHPGRALHEVILKILRGEVVPPRRVRPEVPRDLETICLRCLEPQPSRRYATAEALADDLARFQRGEPVHARPIGRAERFARRVRRHPLVSSLVAAVVVAVGVLGWRTLAPAWVTVPVSPPNARVLVNGRPLRSSGLVWPAGDAVVTVQADEYEAQTRSVSLTPGRRLTLDPFHLELDHGFLSIASRPPGAEVSIDGQAIGRTPLVRAAVHNGGHGLSLRLADHEEWKDQVAVVAGADLNKGTVALTHEQGWLALDGTPRGMTVIVRDARTKEEVTRLPVPVEVPLATGDYVLQGQLKDHFDRDYTIDLKRGDRRHSMKASVSLNRQTLWSFEAGDVVNTRPSLVDLTGDGVLDCVVGSFVGRVYALSGRDGSVLWSYHGGGVSAQSSPAIGDLNGDGVPDCIVGSADNRVYGLSGRDGSLLWSYQAGDSVLSSPAIGDLNGDGVPDCVVGSNDKKVYALSGRDGAVLWSHETGDAVISSPALGDLNGDGVPDCVVGSNDKKVYGLSGRDGSVLWSHEAGDAVTSSPALGDLNGDGVLDCVVGSIDKVFALSGRDGLVLWSHPTGDAANSSPALGDLNGDGVLDCVVGSDDHKVYALSGRDGSVLWSFETGGYVDSSPALGDLDGDGVLDCVVGPYDKKVYALSGRDGSLLWSYETGRVVNSTPALADVDGDGLLDCVFGSEDMRVYALSGSDRSVLWRYQTGDAVYSSPAMGDLNRDGVLDCVVGSCDQMLYALSGRDGSALWSYETGVCVESSPALADLNGDGVLDCIVGLRDNKVHALSGSDRSVLWTHETGGWVSSPTLADLNGDGVLDCVVGSEDKKVYALSGSDGSVLWSCQTADAVDSSPSLGDLNRDGVLDCVVGSCDNRVYALSGLDGSTLWSYETGGPVILRPALRDIDGDGGLECVVGSYDGTVYVIRGSRNAESMAEPVARLHLLRGGQAWSGLFQYARRRAAAEKDPWRSAVMRLHLGLAQLHLGDARGALDAFAEARKLHLRALDGAVFEWIASWRVAKCPADRRAEARMALLDALASQPDVVLDAFVEVRDLLTPEAIADLRSVLDDPSLDEQAQVVRAVLLAAFGSKDASADVLTAAERRLSARLVAAEGPAARWLGYLALLAHGQGDSDRFRRAYATYLGQPRRPESLDALLADLAARK